MRHCFICGQEGRLTDLATGEALCTAHYFSGRSRRAKTDSAEWRMLADIRRWHAGSAYEKDVAMAKRLEGVNP